MSNVRNRNIVVLAPEEWRLPEWAADAKHRARDSLSLPLGHNPMLYPRWFSGNRLRIPSEIACCKNVRGACAKHLVDDNTIVDFYARFIRQGSSWRHANSEDDQARLDGPAFADFNPVIVNCLWFGVEEEPDTVLLMKLLNKAAQFHAQNSSEGDRILTDDRNLAPAAAKGGGDFQPDET